MSRILVLSDSHGYTGALSNIMMHAESMGHFDAAVHLGDGFYDMEPYQTLFPHVFQVPGNCDWRNTQEEPELLIRLFAAPFFMCHGHTAHVKYTYSELCEKARRRGAKIALFGHTHVPTLEAQEGLLLLNPGPACEGRFGVLEITDAHTFNGRLY